MDYWERKRGLKHGAVSRIAERCGCSVSLVSSVLAGTKHNERVQREIARRLKKPVRECFPPTPASAA